MGRYTSRRAVLFVVIVGGLPPALVGCSPRQEIAAGESSGPTSAASATIAAAAVGIGDLAPGLHNVFAVSKGVFSGSGPESEEAFASLAAMGVQTVVSVDGARPEIELAHAHGMRYVHVPIGYDGMGPEQVLGVAKAIESMPGPVYVHCHHGKHRGPTAAAVALVALGRMTNAQAAQFMKEAGTGQSYPGLWLCAREQRVYSEAEMALAPAELPEVRVVSGLV
ncbi:MAG TPA: sulfur transferase domain-containing protein, partial [Phycisphaerales bacterium]|nr:sulfur transferase domain-containing protein [Phycisphaerales bacterium]